MEHEQLKEIYGLHAESVLRYLYSLSRSWEVASDLMQETFIRAALFQGQVHNMRPWLFRIASNLHKNEVRRPYRRESGPLPEEIPGGGFEEDLQRSLFREELLARLEDEGKHYLEIFVLRVDHQLTLEQIGNVIGVSERTIRRQMEHVRNLLREAGI